MSSKEKHLVWSPFLVAAIAAAAACSSDAGDGSASPAERPAASSGRESGSQVFPQYLAKGFAEEASASIPGGGTAAVGRICRGSGADVFYVGVNGATGLADGQHSVSVDKLGEKIPFATGAPDSGVGVGAAQAAFDAAEYTFTFEGLDVTITIAGCAR
jgi:hypothetical protein